MRNFDSVIVGLPVAPIVSRLSEHEESLPRVAAPKALLRGDDGRSTVSSRRAQVDSRIERILAEKKLVQLKRARQRKLKERELKLKMKLQRLKI